MAREFHIKTVTSTESITDLHVTVTTTFQDLLLDFTYTELLESESLYALLSDSNIVAEDENGNSISDLNITPAERIKLNIIEAGATADQTDSEIETAYNNQVSEVSQAEAEAGTGTTVRRWTAQRVKQAIAALSGSSVQKVPCCYFGGKSDSTGKFLIANGKSSDPDDSSKTKTRSPIVYDGTLTKLAYQTKEGTSSTRMKIHINGSVEETVTLSNINANFSGVETISVSVVEGDYVEIEYDGSDKPGECIMYFSQELS